MMIIYLITLLPGILFIEWTYVARGDLTMYFPSGRVTLYLITTRNVFIRICCSYPLAMSYDFFRRVKFLAW